MTNDYFTQHTFNLKKSAGLLDTNIAKYEYILSWEQLVNSTLNQNYDLHYPLRKEIKRDRYIVNTEALREAINKASTQVLNEYQHEIYVFLQNDVTKVIESNAYAILSQVMSLGSTKGNIKSGDLAYKLGAAFGLAIGNAISDIVINDMFK